MQEEKEQQLNEYVHARLQQQDEEHLRIVTGVFHVRRGGHATHG